MMARLQAANIEQAKAELKETTSVAPCFTGTVLALASFNVLTGAVQPAIDDLEAFVNRQP